MSEFAQERYLTQHDFIIANAQKCLKDSWEERVAAHLFQVVIVHEAHHFPAQTWTQIIEKFKSDAMVVFLTATPYRSDRKEVVSRKNFVFFLSLKEAIKKRVIRETILGEITSELDNEKDALVSILNEIHQIQQEKNEKHPLPNNIPHMAIAIARNVSSAKTAVALWMDRFGDTAFFYNSTLYRRGQQIMTRIKENNVKLVVMVDVVREVFDHPPITIAAILTKITSPVKFVQFIGRAQRIVRSGGEPESQSIVADVVTHSRFQQRRNYEMFQNGFLVPENDPNDG